MAYLDITIIRGSPLKDGSKPITAIDLALSVNSKIVTKGIFENKDVVRSIILDAVEKYPATTMLTDSPSDLDDLHAFLRVSQPHSYSLKRFVDEMGVKE